LLLTIFSSIFTTICIFCYYCNGLRSVTPLLK